jgi:DNA-binding LytR/AlgR family response regulator
MVTSLTYASVDDEPASHEALRALMRAHPDFLDQGRFLNPVDALRSLATAPVDLVFVDVEMPRMSGLEFLAAHAQRGIAVLLTAYAEHALRAYDLGVRDYLLKPVSAPRLAQCLERLRPLLMLQRTGTPGQAAALAFAVGRELRYVRPDDIVTIDAEANFSNLVTADGSLFASESLKALEARLTLFGFVRIHKGHLVNRAHVRSWSGEDLVLTGGLLRPVGRAYRQQARQALSG